MKKKLRNSHWVALILAVVVALTSCSEREDHAGHSDTYTCPMHPTVVSDRPGTCPICGMDLVRKRQGEEVEITEDLARLIKSPNELVVGSIKTIKGIYKSLPITVDAQGIVTYDTRKIYAIPARVSGRLERIYLNHAFQRVSKGQKVMDIYSPELVAAQRELVFILERDSANRTLIAAAKRKLELLGISGNQIRQLITSRRVANTISVYSPYSGYLITGEQTTSNSQRPVSSSNPGMDANMNDGTAPNEASLLPVLTREGDYVTAGQTLFTIVNNDALRIELLLPDRYGKSVSKGDSVEFRPDGADSSTGTIELVQPFFNKGDNFLRLRLYTTRTERLHVGQLVSARVNVGSTEALWVPKEAVLKLGTQSVVFVREREALRPKAVTTGMSADGMIEIKTGLASSDEIAAKAQFLVDSDSFIKPMK